MPNTMLLWHNGIQICHIKIIYGHPTNKYTNPTAKSPTHHHHILYRDLIGGGGPQLSISGSSSSLERFRLSLRGVKVVLRCFPPPLRNFSVPSWLSSPIPSSRVPPSAMLLLARKKTDFEFPQSLQLRQKAKEEVMVGRPKPVLLLVACADIVSLPGRRCWTAGG